MIIWVKMADAADAAPSRTLSLIGLVPPQLIDQCLMGDSTMTPDQKGPQTARREVADGRMLAQATQLDPPNPTHAPRRLKAYPRTTPMPRPHPLPSVLTTSGALLLALLAPWSWPISRSGW
jgi:hypothetical protein